MEDTFKVAVLYIIDKKLLMCRKKGLVELINLGGKVEKGETYVGCAEREVMEEAQCKVIDLGLF